MKSYYKQVYDVKSTVVFICLVRSPVGAGCGPYFPSTLSLALGYLKPVPNLL